MVVKRKRDEEAGPVSDVVAKPAAGTRVFISGKAVKEGLSAGNRQSLVAFHQQILTLHSQLPLPISHPTVVVIQHYLDLSPTCDEIFVTWQEGDKRRDEKLVEAAVQLLAQIIRILTPLPFFRNLLVGIVDKLLASQERYHDHLSRMINSANRETTLAGLALAAAAMQVDKPDPSTSSSNNSSGRLSLRLWTTLVEGGVVKNLGKLLIMRKRKKDGTADYGKRDPLDRPDMRHLCLDIICPLFCSPIFHSHTRQIMKSIYTQFEQDPPITIYRILTAIWEAITAPSPGTGRKAALALLDERAIDNILTLFNRDESEPTTGKSLPEIASAFLEGVTTVPGRGICFVDEGWYPRRQSDNPVAVRMNELDDDEQQRGGGSREDRLRRGLHNRILSNVVRRLGGKVVDDNGRIGQWAIKLLQACPELVAGYWPNSALAVEPRLHARWMATMAYVGHIVSLPAPPLSTFRQHVPRGIEPGAVPFKTLPPALETVVESVLPSPLTKQHMTKGLQHADHLVQYMTAMTIARCLQKLAVTQALFLKIEQEVGNQPSTSTLPFNENPWARRRKELEMECRRRLPEILVIISFAQKSATLAPPDLEGEVDPTLSAESAMLTESALRLFRLYHSTLPLIAQDAKFDPGRLLVSSSSVKQERRERKEAKANGGTGSVVDETRSGVSVGTMGTAGMGGGFGYAKGNVEGFEALSQVHVLKLLGAVKGWQWTSKASASQYTYFYHILQLHLASNNPTTTLHSTALLSNLLLATPLYDHDPSELSAFLSALPRLPSESGAAGVIQQVHFLSFIDDCVRRCTKLPYRYIDETIALVPDYFLIGEQWSLPSPLLMAILEQWIAKVSGQHISSEAAGVVARVIRRLMLLTLGKMRDTKWVEAYISRMEGVLQKLREEGKDKEGLEGVVKEIRGDVERVKGEVNQVGQEGKSPLAELLDETEWRAESFEYNLLNSSNLNIETRTKLLEEISFASAGTRARHAQFAAHLLASRLSDRATLLNLIQTALGGIADQILASRGKDAVLSGKWIQEAYLSATDHSCRNELDSLATLLDPKLPKEKAIAEPYVLELLKAIQGDKKGKHILDVLHLLFPWTRFLQPEQVAAILTKIGTHQDRLVGITKKGKPIVVSDRVKLVLGDLVAQAGSTALALQNLTIFIDLGVIDPLVRLVNAHRHSRQLKDDFDLSGIDGNVICRLTYTEDPASLSLLQALLLTYPSVAAEVSELLSGSPDVLKRTSLLPVVFGVCESPCGSSLLSHGQIPLEATVSALRDSQCSLEITEAAIDTLELFSGHNADVVNTAISEITDFTPAAARLLERLAPVANNRGLRLGPIMSLALRYAVRVCADLKPLSVEDLGVLSSLTTSLSGGAEKDLDVMLVEPVMTAIMQDRLNDAVPLELATALVDRCELRASFIRQHLQLLLSSSLYTSIASPSSSPADRLPFVRLYSGLFHASTYTSCQPNFVEPLLPLYRGTLSLSDRLLLGMWRTFESVRHISVSSILIHWSSGGSPSNRAFDAITSLDPSKVLSTCSSFPLRRNLTGAQLQEEFPADEKVYDPVFVLSLLAAMMADDLTGLDWVEVLRSNALGLAVVALASRDAGMRDLAGFCLGRTVEIIKDKPFHERDQLLHTLLLIQHALVPHPSHTSITPRLPTLPTLFLAHVLHAQSQPSHFLYPLTSRFIFQRPVFDPWDVPMLYTLLLGDRSEARGKGEPANAQEVKRDRGWIVRLIRDGTRSEADWTLLKRRRVWTYLADMYHISLDIPFRRIILQAMESMTRIPQAARTLVHRNHLITWCSLQFQLSLLQPARNAAEERGRLVGLVESCVRWCVEGELAKRVKGDKGQIKAEGGEDDDESSDSSDGGEESDEEELDEEKDQGVTKKKSGDDSDVDPGLQLFHALRNHRERADWLIRTERFVTLAAETADITRLTSLARITYTISTLSPTSTSILLPSSVRRLTQLHPDPHVPLLGTIQVVDLVFRAGLALGGREGVRVEMGVNVEQARWAVEEIGYRAGLGEGEVAEWVKKEKGRYRWDKWKASH